MVPFFNTILGIVLQYLINTLGKKVTGLPTLSTFSYWYYSVPLMILQGFIFLIIAYLIDLKYHSYFKKPDNNQVSGMTPL